MKGQKGDQCGHSRGGKMKLSGHEVPELIGLRKECEFYSKCFLARVIVCLLYGVAGAQILELGCLGSLPGFTVFWTWVSFFSLPQFLHLLNGEKHPRAVVKFKQVKFIID